MGSERCSFPLERFAFVVGEFRMATDDVCPQLAMEFDGSTIRIKHRCGNLTRHWGRGNDRMGQQVPLFTVAGPASVVSGLGALCQDHVDKEPRFARLP
jgi:hypothetical protein